jgi:hypothetical protein
MPHTSPGASKELHDALEKAMKKNDQLTEGLADQIKDMELVGTPGLSTRGTHKVSFTGRIFGVDDLDILSVNVLDEQENTFTCEVELEAGLCVDLNVEVEEYHHYEPPSLHFHTIQRTIYHYFYAEVITKFDQQAPEEIDFESIHVSGNSVELRADQIE